MAKVSFVLDRGVISALRGQDVLHIVRTSCGRVGVSATRSGQLIFAVGALTRGSLGSDFEARIPMALVREAEAVFRKHDDGFQFLEYPVEIRVSGEKHILYEGRIDLGSFEVWVLHGYYLGMPGRDPCISVVRKGACPVVDANTSALFLDSGTLEMVHWTDH